MFTYQMKLNGSNIRIETVKGNMFYIGVNQNYISLTKEQFESVIAKMKEAIEYENKH